jgi:hypothetical protein
LLDNYGPPVFWIIERLFIGSPDFLVRYLDEHFNFVVAHPADVNAVLLVMHETFTKSRDVDVDEPDLTVALNHNDCSVMRLINTNGACVVDTNPSTTNVAGLTG